jgi:arginase
MQKNNIDLIGVPSNLGCKDNGVNKGPDYLRSFDIVKKLKTCGLNLNDLGNTISFNRDNLKIKNQKEKYANEIELISQDLKTKIEQSLTNGNKILTLGGDHSLVIGSIGAAVAYQTKNKKSLGIIWVDAHPDLNNSSSTISGFIHGMGLQKNIENYPSSIKKENIILIGLKDVDPFENEFIKSNNMKAFFIRDILLDGFKPIFKEISELKNQVDNIWISFDLDSIDKDFAPGVGMPNKGGLTYREATNLATFLGSEFKDILMGVDIAEYNPDNDQDNKTAELALELTAYLFNKEYSDYINYLKNVI